MNDDRKKGMVPQQHALQIRMQQMLGTPQQQQQQQGPLIPAGQSGAAPALGAPTVGLTDASNRTYIWQGVLEWIEKGNNPSDQQKVTRNVPCQVSAISRVGEPELKADSWPQKLIMQLIPKKVIRNIGGHFFKNSKLVLFHPQPNEALESLTNVMVKGFAGCVHFTRATSPSCDIKVLILLYTPEKKAYLGFIPNNQDNFVDGLKKIIQQAKRSQVTSKQGQGAVGMATGALQDTPISQSQTSNPPTLNELSKFTLKDMTAAFRQIRNGIRKFKNMDPDTDRFSNVRHLIEQSLACYKEIFKEKIQQSKQTTLDMFVRKINPTTTIIKSQMDDEIIID